MVEFPFIDPEHEDRRQPMTAQEEAAADEAIAIIALIAGIMAAAGLFAAAFAHPAWSLRWMIGA